MEQAQFQSSPSALATLLGRDFSVCDLGSSGATDLRLGDLLEHVTLIEVDALGACPPMALARYHRRHVFHNGIAGTEEVRTFKVRAYAGCSGFVDPVPALVEAYGLQEHFQEIERIDIECLTLPRLLSSAGLTRVDWLKTDLEGLDYEVLRSSPHVVRHALAVQCELRFQPFYDGEPNFDEAMALLRGHGFELVALRPEAWRYATPGREMSERGRVVWADAVFFLRADAMRTRFPAADLPAMWAKQILLAQAVGPASFAEHLLSIARATLTPAVVSELETRLTRGRGPSHQLRRLVERLAGVVRVPSLWWALQRGLGALERLTWRLALAAGGKAEDHLGRM
jgi:hypothetical protein